MNLPVVRAEKFAVDCELGTRLHSYCAALKQLATDVLAFDLDPRGNLQRLGHKATPACRDRNEFGNGLLATDELVTKGEAERRMRQGRGKHDGIVMVASPYAGKRGRRGRDFHWFGRRDRLKIVRKVAAHDTAGGEFCKVDSCAGRTFFVFVKLIEKPGSRPIAKEETELTIHLHRAEGGFL